MHWQWWYLPLILGFLAAVRIIDLLTEIRNSLRNIEEHLEPKHDYEAEAGCRMEDTRGPED